MTESKFGGFDGLMPREFKVDDSLMMQTLMPSDAKRIFEILHSDPEIQEFYVTWVAGAKTEEEIAERIRGFNDRQGLRYGILLDGELVGYLGAFKSPQGRMSDKEYDMGYFCDPTKRGQGIIPRSVTALMKELVENRGAESFALYIADRNGPSQAVAKKLGFTRTDEVAFDDVLQIEERRYERQAA